MSWNVFEIDIISKNMNSSIVSSDMQSLHASTALNRSAHNAQSV